MLHLHCVSEKVCDKNAMGNSGSIVFLGKLCSTSIIRSISVYDVSFVGVGVMENGCLDNGVFQMYKGCLMFQCPIEFHLLPGE